MKKIAFHSNQLGLRGTEVALYRYAQYNEEILNNKSVIFAPPGADMSTYKKFKDRFEVALMDFGGCEGYLLENGFDYFYTTQMGLNQGYVLNSVPTLVHAVFRFNDPHGHKYFYISDWLCRDQGYDTETHSLPYICEKLPTPQYDFRKKHNISKDSIVFGCYGGLTEFNIDFVKQAIINTIEKNNKIYFIFMNINKFCDHSQVLFFPGSYDLFEKSAFVDACDAMIHARSGGETFGLAVAEFALSNKPVITYGGSGERCHLEILGERAIVYNTYEEVLDVFNELNSYLKYSDYDRPYKEQFSPGLIMEKFNRVFLT